VVDWPDADPLQRLLSSCEMFRAETGPLPHGPANHKSDECDPGQQDSNLLILARLDAGKNKDFGEFGLFVHPFPSCHHECSESYK
jgi:hypothetical protein